MNSEILAKLRNVLVRLYPDEASMHRISHDAGLDLAFVMLNSSAVNNWHSILIEAYKLDRVDVLLTIIKQEYGSNQEFIDACKGMQKDDAPKDDDVNHEINFIVPLGDWHNVRNDLFKKQGETDTSTSLQKRFKTFDWSKAEQAYLDKLIKLYDRVRILGNSVDVPLGNLFTEVYILDKPTASNRYDIEELRKQENDLFNVQLQPGERIKGLDLVKTNQNLFILGKPGAGKTTFLKYITIQAAHKQLPRIPIFVSLNQWADSRWGKGEKAVLLPFLIEQFDTCNFPDASLFIEYLLQRGLMLILFDGLDEVKLEKDQRYHLTRLLQDFAYKYHSSQYLITCRIAASDYAFSGFAHVEVADFTPDQVSEYAHKWFGDQQKKFDTFKDELAKTENKGLAELCNTPLLLALLCLTFDNSMRFPPNRAELYEDALDTLLRKWDSSRQIQRDEIYHELSHKRKLQLLMHIAVPAFQKGAIFFRQRDLEKRIVDYLAKLPDAPLVDTLDSTSILKAMEAQHGILVERAQSIYSFSHLTFQEYLTARYLAENLGKEAINKLFRTYLTNQRWREIFLLTASLLDDADEFIHILRGAVNDVISDSVIMLRLLDWVNDVTHRINAPIERRSIIRLAYIFLAFSRLLTRALAQTRARGLPRTHDVELANMGERVLNRTIAFVLTFNSDYEIAPALDRSRSLALALAHNLASAFDHNFLATLRPNLIRDLPPISTLAHVTDPQVGIDYGLYYAWSYSILFASEKVESNDYAPIKQKLPSLIGEIVTLASNAGLHSLVQQLTFHSIPSPNASSQIWREYVKLLFSTMHNQRNLEHEWDFNQQDFDKLNNYLYVNEILFHCLRVSVISNRQAMFEEVLVPLKAKKNIE